MPYRSKSLLLSICVLLQAACSNNAVYYPEESFAYDSLFKLRTDGEVALACESARRSLLGEGYLIERANSEGVVGRKAYKSEGKQNTFIEMNIVCAPDAKGSTVYATGVLSTYTLKMSSSSASVGVSALGSISLPIGQSADSLVKVSEETINDKEFYRRFFAAVDITLGDLMAGRAALEPVPAKVAPAPAAEAMPAPAAPKPKSKPKSEPKPKLEPEPESRPKPKPKPKPVKEEPAPVETSAPKVPEPVATPVAPTTAPESPVAAPAPTPVSEQKPAAKTPKPTPAPSPVPSTPAAIVPEPVPAQEEAPAKAAPEEIPAPPIEPVTTGT